MPRQTLRSSSGFTLVELLVVIGIIALLISILLPVLGKARESARLVQCQSNLRQFFMADSFYVNRYRGWHLPGWTGGGTAGAPNAFLNVPAMNGIDFWTSMEEFRKATAMPWLENTGANARPVRAYLVKERLCPEMIRGFQDLYNGTNDPQTGFKDLYVDYSYGMNVEGVDYNKTNATDPVYNPCLLYTSDAADE